MQAKENITFSIVVSTFNRATLLPRLVQSALMQKYSQWELVIVDDGGTDSTKELLESYNDSRIKYFYKVNEERSAARNYGIDKATGDYIIFIDSDDELGAHCLENLYQAAVVNKDSVPHILSVKNHFYKGSIFVKELDSIGDRPSPIDIFEQYRIISVVQCAHISCFKNNRFKEEFSLWEDTHFWLRMIAQFPIVKSEAIAKCYIHEGSGVQQGFANVKFTDVLRYTKAVNDLLNYSDLFPAVKYKKLISEYNFSKLKMYFYQARINKQFSVAHKVLLESYKYKFDFIYILKSYLHILKGLYK